MDLGSDVVFTFARKTSTMNLVVIAKFFHIICKKILLSLFASKYCDGSLLKPISTYFDMIKINGCNMFYLHYLVWLKKESYLLTLYAKIQENKDFCMRLLAFLEHIIKCSANDDIFSDALHYSCFDAYKANTIKDFIAQFKENSKTIAKKV